MGYRIKNQIFFLCLTVFSVGLLIYPLSLTQADVFVNVLAVNGSEEAKEKEIKEYLPKELKEDDILDTAGLDVSYDVAQGAYYVHSQIALESKESKVFKVRVRDLWQIEPELIDHIKKEIDLSLERIKDTEYYETGEIKKETLLQRLDYVVAEQNRFSGNTGKRIDHYRNYVEELEGIRHKSLSVKYWHSRPPTTEEAGIVSFIIEVSNPDEERTFSTGEKKHYAPAEVKPEHFVDLKGFDVRYDAIQKKSYLTKEETLQPSEKKRYEISIIDVWKIPQRDIESLKDRTRATYELLKGSDFKDSADYLVQSIKEHLRIVEDSQDIDREIQEHISAYRGNNRNFVKAEKDVKALEEILEHVREELERSKLENVLQKVSSLNSIAKIAQSIFRRPQINTAWKIILWIVVFVGLYTFGHFVLWGKRSKGIKNEDLEEYKTDDKK